jgi:hypothetical protein
LAHDWMLGTTPLLGHDVDVLATAGEQVGEVGRICADATARYRRIFAADNEVVHESNDWPHALLYSTRAAGRRAASDIDHYALG